MLGKSSIPFKPKIFLTAHQGYVYIGKYLLPPREGGGELASDIQGGKYEKGGKRKIGRKKKESEGKDAQIQPKRVWTE
jgi:hypothetical protein